MTIDNSEAVNESAITKQQNGGPNSRKKPASDNDHSSTAATNYISTAAQQEEEEELDNVTELNPSYELETPVKRGRGRPKGSKKVQSAELDPSTPTKPSRVRNLFSTPQQGDKVHLNGTPSHIYNADRSARRKSARTIIERNIADLNSDDEADEELARHIYEDDGEKDLAEDGREGSDEEAENELETPSKRKRGRPNGSTKRRQSPSPSPPRYLPPHELYFTQNRGAGMKTSNSTLASLSLLNHEEYFNLRRNYKDPHADDVEFLHELHSRSFNQWQFELSQDFNICIYGWGSKRALLTKFATHIYNAQRDHENQKIVVINGYVQNSSIRDILNTISSAISDHPQKLGSQVAEMFETLCNMLEAEKAKHITLIIHSIDASPLRRSTTQTLLARLASHPQIQLIASADHPSFPLLWDSSLRSTYNFLSHDCTTFQQYAAELDVVNEVHELLGRSGRRVGGKEGVSFVLKSLNQNSRKLFQLLVAEQLAVMEDNVGGELTREDDEDHEDAINGFNLDNRHGKSNGNRRNENEGVEYRLLYQKAVEDFICGDEVSFRTLLKECVCTFILCLITSMPLE